MKNILIVDDEASIGSLLERFLVEAGYSCWVVENVQQAKNILQKQSIDLVLSDMNMPGESGIALIKYLNQKYPDVAIIIVSVVDNPNAAKEAFELGVYGYIVKPFTKNIVLIAVQNGLRRQQLEVQSNAYREELENRVYQQTTEIHSQFSFLQNLVNAIPNAIFNFTHEGILLGCNKSFAQFVGKSKEMLIGKSLSEFLPENLAAIYRQEDELLQENDRQNYEIVATDANGNKRDFLVNKAISVDKDGQVEGIIGVLVDITDQKEMELAYRVSEEKFRQIVNNIKMGVVLLSPQFEILQMNPQMQIWFPHIVPNNGSICYQSFQKPGKESPCDNCPVVKTLAEGKSFEAIVEAGERGVGRYFRDQASPIRDENGNVTGAILLVEEVTQKLALERELRQAQKLESIGQLAAGIAHEINTPVQYIGDNTEFLRDSFSDIGRVFSTYKNFKQKIGDNICTADELLQAVDEAVQEADINYLSEEIPRAIEQSLEGVQRVTEIVRAMRDFSHPGGDKKTLVDLNKAIHSTVTVARNEWKYVAEMELDLDTSLPQVPCLPGEINQVLLNIIVNASHAIQDFLEKSQETKGKITIATRNNKDRVAISITDTGAGIPEKVQHRIFDPFFTTKSVGKGTGQGLAIAHNVIVDKHGGSLRFETEQGRGTTFIIELPLDADLVENGSIF